MGFYASPLNLSLHM